MSPLRLILCAVILVSAVQAEDDKYTDKYDWLNVYDILTNDRLLNMYIKCLLDTGMCSPDIVELKENLRDSLTNNCSKCTPKQKDLTKMVFAFLMKNKPDEYAQLEKKYDPAGIYRKAYAAKLAQIKT